MTRVRFAPSPTGYLHIGGARTFIFNWLHARHQGGAVVLRIDDTDVERNTQTSLDSIYEGLQWLELGWDEFYRQSDRLDLHRRAAWAIFEKGLAYRDFTPASTALESVERGPNRGEVERQPGKGLRRNRPRRVWLHLTVGVAVQDVNLDLAKEWVDHPVLADPGARVVVNLFGPLDIAARG